MFLMSSKTGILFINHIFFSTANFIIPGFKVKITTHRIILTHPDNKDLGFLFNIKDILEI